MMAGKEVILVVISYCLGCLTGGYYLVKLRTGKDIRQFGSGNVGAKNVGRVLGWPGFIGTFLLDFGKGALAVAIGGYCHAGSWTLMAMMLAVVAGHNWPIQLRGQGGKGISTSLGAILALDGTILFALLVGAVPALLLTRNFTLSGLFGFALAPLVIRMCGQPDTQVVGLSLLAILVVGAHHKNVRDELMRLSVQRETKGSGDPTQPGRRVRHET